MSVKDLISILERMPEEAEVQNELGFPVEAVTVKKKEEKEIVRIA